VPNSWFGQQLYSVSATHACGPFGAIKFGAAAFNPVSVQQV